MKKGRLKEIALDGVIRQNPSFRLVLGTCPTLALTTAAASCLGMGAAVTFVLICSNVIISLLRNVIPDKVRIPCFIVIIASFVTLVRMFMQAYIPDLYATLGVFLPLIVVNCIILGRAEGFASHNPVGESALDGLFMGIGFTLALTAMGIFREVLAYGTIFGNDLWTGPVIGVDPQTGATAYGPKFTIGFFGSNAGAFLTYALFIAVFSAIYNAVERKAHKKAARKASLAAAAVAVEEVQNAQ